MKVITIRIDEVQYSEIKRLVESGEFKNISDVIRAAIAEFVRSRKLRWKNREELRKYLAKKGKYRPSGEIIELVRKEE